jgi:hypothetical protein
MRKLALLAVLVAIGVLSVAAMAFADRGNDGKRSFSTQLDGWAETPSVVTTGHGSFRLRVVSADRWEFVLSYEDLEGGTVSAAHIHVGSHHESGGVSAHLCGGTQPPCHPGPDGDVSGVILAKDVTGPGPPEPGQPNRDQGVEPGNMADLLRAIRVGETYANVHTTPRFPGGEIRGQLADRHNHGGRGDNDDD